ncbi:hypothetical protein [Clostridium paraputrificum]|uniref:hypothetical protein n=1 Tax=Clostridium paraputrificum TaxID=29363 RepID=UPI00041596EC|nr:hypothetical protein [Clostridium paraputrificum]
MYYIPMEWVKNPDNLDKVYSILNELTNDIKPEDGDYKQEDAIRDIRALGEDIIAEKLLNEIWK